MASSVESSVIGRPFSVGSCLFFLSFAGIDGELVALGGWTGKSIPNGKMQAAESTIDRNDLAEAFTTSENAGRVWCDFMERFSTDSVARQQRRWGRRFCRR